MSKTPPVQDVKQGKYYIVDFRAVKPIDRAGGNARTIYEGVPDLAYSFIETGFVANKIDSEETIKASELLNAVPREQWKDKLNGKFLVGAINTALVGYSKSNEESGIGKYYHTLAGHRRTLAADFLFKEYGIVTVVPVIPKDVRGMTDLDILKFMLGENENRKGLNIIDQAAMAQRMVDAGAEIGEIAIAFGRRRHYYFIKNLLKIHAAPEEVKDMIRSGRIAASNVIALIDEHKEDEEKIVSVIREAYNKVQGQSKGSKPAKIKSKDIVSAKSTRTIDSKIELALFFRKHKEFDTEKLSGPWQRFWTKLSSINENKITVSELEIFFEIQ